MSICDSCIHDDVCGLEDNHEEGIVSCADRIPKDTLDKIQSEIEEIETYDGLYIDRAYVLEIIDKYKAESEVRE